jgi:sugar-specific transcriptional regulator TrmB
MEKEVFFGLGLNEKEIEIFSVLLNLGTSPASKVAKKSNSLRTSVYDYLNDLIDKGFVTYSIRNNKKYFTAIEPEKILEKFNEKKSIEEESILKLIMQLKTNQNKDKEKIDVEVYEGKEGMKTAMNLMLQSKELLFYGSSGVSYKLLPIFMEKWNKDRLKKKVFLKIIYNYSELTKKRLEEGPKLDFAEVKFFSENNYSIIGTGITEKMVLLTFWNTQTPFAIAINNDELVKNYKNNFEILWKQATIHPPK